MQGFLNIENKQDKGSLHLKMPHCGRCGLRKQCNNPNMKPRGKGKKKILIVADDISSINDRVNSPLAGSSEELVERKLKEVGIDLWEDCLVTSAVRCASNQDLTPAQIENCKPNLWKVINKFKPKIIIAMGNNGVRSLFSHRVNQDSNASLWRSFVIPDVNNTKAWICPVSDPAFILHDKKYGQVALSLFEQDLQQMTNYLKEELPEPLPTDDVLIENEQSIVDLLKALDKKPKLIAVDYETNMLKPHSSESQLVTAGFAGQGFTPFAYELKDDRRIEMTANIIDHPNALLIAANMLMEIGWSTDWLNAYGNWVWDTVLSAHVLDNRRKTANVKFQGFVNFGIEKYDDHIEPFLKATEKGCYEKNRIHEVNKQDLLKYNAIDALIEYELALKQMHILDIDPKELI